MTAPIRVLIVDDEPLARTHLRNLLAADGEVEVIGECGNGQDAVEAIRRQEPDLLFLDILMPELDGFEVVDAVGPDAMPVVVFVTAYDEYALKAFEAHALDYLMKPVSRARFHRTVERAKGMIRGAPGHDDLRGRLEHLLDKMGGAPRHLERLAIKTEGRVIFLKVDQIDWMEAADDHVRFHVGQKTYLHRDTLTRLEQRLPPAKFLRIHRSTIVNVDRIREMQPWFQGDYVVILTDGTRLTSGRNYREKLRALLEESR